MFSARVDYKNLGLSNFETEVAIRLEDLAVRLLDAGIDPTEQVLNFLKRTDPKTSTMYTLTRAGLGDEFRVMESHCGQIAYMPKGWEWLVGPGPGTLTKHQAFRRIDRPIYAAQFHIEMSGTPENSRQIMGNFLTLARRWGGWNPKGKIE